MTYIYLETPEGAQLLTLRSTDRWYLICDYDQDGNACIYLNVLGNEYPICCSTEYTQDNADLPIDAVAEYYNAVIKEIYCHIQDCGTSYIDIAAIKNDVLIDYWLAWMQAEYINDKGFNK